MTCDDFEIRSISAPEDWHELVKKVKVCNFVSARVSLLARGLRQMCPSNNNDNNDDTWPRVAKFVFNRHTWISPPLIQVNMNPLALQFSSSPGPYDTRRSFHPGERARANPRRSRWRWSTHLSRENATVAKGKESVKRRNKGRWTREEKSKLQLFYIKSVLTQVARWIRGKRGRIFWKNYLHYIWSNFFLRAILIHLGQKSGKIFEPETQDEW